MPLESMAFTGFAGEVVRAIAEYTEAHPVALLATLLTYFGSIVGKGPHVVADEAEHPARIFAFVVGNSARARKGTSARVIQSLFDGAVPQFVSGRVLSGLSSGEDLIGAGSCVPPNVRSSS